MLELISDGVACRGLRKATGTSIKILAKRARVSENTVFRFENDCNVRYITKRSIFRALYEIMLEYADKNKMTLEDIYMRADPIVDKILGHSE